MRLQLFKKYISSIEELMGVIHENQSIFEVLKNTDAVYKKSLLAEYLEKRAGNKLIDPIEIYKTYDLSMFKLAFLMKKHRLKKPEDMTKGKELKFRIRARYFTKRYVLIMLNHYESDDLDDVMEYAKKHTASTLEKKLSIWERITVYINKVFRKIKQFIRSIVWQKRMNLYREL